MGMAGDPGRIPRDVLAAIVRNIIASAGSTITAIEAERGRKYDAEALQEEYREKSVWHTRSSIIKRVADELRIHPMMLGPQRISSDFYNMVDEEIGKLRRRGDILDWNLAKRAGIMRFAAADSPAPIPRPEFAPNSMKLNDADLSRRGQSTAHTTYDEMKRTFLAILDKGRKDNTYKFALARALLDHCNESATAVTQKHEIPYEYLAGKFLEYYWHQVCTFRIRQDFHTRHTTKIVGIINEMPRQPARFDLLEEEDLEAAKQKILDGIFGHARMKTSLVVPKFQKILEGRIAVERRIFYEYDDEEKKICLRPAAFEFLRRNRRLLMKAVTLEWAKFLERVNTRLPKLVAKVEGDVKKRGPLKVFEKAYSQYHDHCFYCMGRFENGLVEVDHFIPWSYIFEDDAWNLVLACRDCNCKKSNSLPRAEFQECLIKRNKKYSDQIRLLESSLRLLDTGGGWEREIKNHYSNCSESGFGLWNGPR